MDCSGLRPFEMGCQKGYMDLSCKKLDGVVFVCSEELRFLFQSAPLMIR